MKLLASGNFGEHISVAGNNGYPSYIVKGGKINLMVDAALSFLGPSYLKSVENILGSKDRLNMLFLTHSHYDHLGSAPYFKMKIQGLEVGGSARIEELLKKESVIERMNSLNDILRVFFADEAGSEDVRITGMSLEHHLKDGDSFDLGGITCLVLGAEGHTRDSMAYYIPETGVLFQGESAGVPLGLDGSGVQVEFLSSYNSYVKNIERYIDLRPKIVAMGHGWVFTDDDAKKFLDESLNATEKYRDMIEGRLDTVNGDIEKAVDIIARVEYDEKGNIYQERNAYLTNLRAQVRLIAEMHGAIA
jgi:glyoxylase-like metal-dependent hydrolase (beta-lactamase superfamily II)